MTAELLLEIGTEEIPAGYLENGLEELKRLAGDCLRENRIDLTGGLDVYGTPRRLVLIARGVSKKQQDLTQEVTGPPKKVAYDKNGAPTKAAAGFAKKQGVSVHELQTIETSKGEYLYVKQEIPGRPTLEILSERLPGIIGEIPWPKSMRWGEVGFPFVRPVHWILCLFDGQMVSFEAAGVQSGNNTFGHRFMAPEGVNVSTIDDYQKAMENAFVVLDPHERQQVVLKVARDAAANVGGVPADDPELVQTVANLTEYPTAVCGSFENAFLDLPDAVLITAMREHQKYFAVYDDQGSLMPNFVAINNTMTRDESVVCRGHERVLRARLSDANFFLKEDRKRPLLERLEDLKQVIYQAQLGTSYAKVMRIEALTAYIAAQVIPKQIDRARLAARLAKCDLVTHMVIEFPSLQGAVGKAYAELEGYDEEISSGIYDHYLPLKAGGALPQTQIGAVVGMADRLDTIAGCFAVGLEPTGKADPFALRRHALAIIRIIEDTGWDLSFKALVEKALSLLAEDITFDFDDTFGRLTAFIRERYKNMMLRSDYASDLVEAAICGEFDRILSLRPKMEQLTDFALSSEEFTPLALTFKRVNNIIKNQGRMFSVDPALFKEDAEKDLWKTYQSLKDDVEKCIGKSDFLDALGMMTRLRTPVDQLFDHVEILTDNEALRENRVGLLQLISSFVLTIADFSKFSI
ncbi:MAG: glycine--tRNA ligase subunit beta [Deltaproteobacteria bacterium]|nr:glycine--tRNA ligase subunit beta [Deltaproteobacteria bacterium]